MLRAPQIEWTTPPSASQTGSRKPKSHACSRSIYKRRSKVRSTSPLNHRHSLFHPCDVWTHARRKNPRDPRLSQNDVNWTQNTNLGGVRAFVIQAGNLVRTVRSPKHLIIINGRWLDAGAIKGVNH